MKLEASIRDRLSALQSQVPDLVAAGSSRAECSAWLTSAKNIVHLICPLFSPYRSQIDLVCMGLLTTTISDDVLEVAAILRHLVVDVDAGLIRTFEDRASAEAFGIFLDHAAEYLRKKRKPEAGAIAGVVFEDTLRRICRRAKITEQGVGLEILIAELVKKEKLSTVKAERARGSARLRAKATHAQWDEFDMQDVGSTIKFTRELIADHLGA